MKRIDLVFENRNCLIFNKPPGLPVQGGEGIEVSLDSILTKTSPLRPLLVHRLDKDTSGLILTAKNREAAARFSALFAGRAILKQYLAVCAGLPRPPEGRVRLTLEVRGRKKESETRYRVLASEVLELPGFGKRLETSLLELELGTGRTHQIRRHLAGIGCPVLGDDKYGDFALNKKLRQETGLKRLFLHAYRLRIPEIPDLLPQGLDISAPPPEHFRALQLFRSWFDCAGRVKDINPGAHSLSSTCEKPEGAGREMEVKFLKKGIIKIAGYSIQTTMDEGKNLRDIPKFWAACVNDGRMRKLRGENFVKNHDEYGVCLPGKSGSGEMEYIIALEVIEGTEIPGGYRSLEIPPADYAVFSTPPSRGKEFSGGIQKLWERIFAQWLPVSGYGINEKGLSYELYPESRVTEKGTVCEIYIPVEN